MLSPTVIELPRSLEATSRDTFADAAWTPAPRRPRRGALPANVVELRPGIASSAYIAPIAA